MKFSRNNRHGHRTGCRAPRQTSYGLKACSTTLAILFVTLTRLFGEELAPGSDGPNWSSLLSAPRSLLQLELIPTAEGTNWTYEMIQESANGSLDLSQPTKTERFEVMYRIGGMLKTDNNDFTKLELYRDHTLVSTDLVTVDDRGIICSARIDEKGRVTTFQPPQTLVKMPLKAGETWNFDGQIGGTKVNQRYEIRGQEDVDVPAGKFHAWHIHCQQTVPTAATTDRWFVSGTGFVKVTTQIKTPSGDMLQQTSLDLKIAPKIGAQANMKPATGKGELSVGVSKGPVGVFATTFSSDTPAIYARWQGRGLRPQSRTRAVWIAEDVADVEPDYQIDEASAVAPAQNSRGTFTISQPEGGWAPGNYRVEFYLDGQLTDSVKLTITK